MKITTGLSALAVSLSFAASAAQAEKWDMALAYSATNYHSEIAAEFAAEVTSPLLYRLDALEPPQSGSFNRSELERTRLR